MFFVRAYEPYACVRSEYLIFFVLPRSGLPSSATRLSRNLNGPDVKVRPVHSLREWRLCPNRPPRQCSQPRRLRPRQPWGPTRRSCESFGRLNRGIARMLFDSSQRFSADGRENLPSKASFSVSRTSIIAILIPRKFCSPQVSDSTS